MVFVQGHSGRTGECIGASRVSVATFGVREIDVGSGVGERGYGGVDDHTSCGVYCSTGRERGDISEMRGGVTVHSVIWSR